MDDDIKEEIRNLRDLYRDKGLDDVREMVELIPVHNRHYGDALIKEFEEKERLNRDEQRGIEALKIAKRAQLISIVAVIVAIGSIAFRFYLAQGAELP